MPQTAIALAPLPPAGTAATAQATVTPAPLAGGASPFAGMLALLCANLPPSLQAGAKLADAKPDPQKPDQQKPDQQGRLPDLAPAAVAAMPASVASAATPVAAAAAQVSVPATTPPPAASTGTTLPAGQQTRLALLAAPVLQALALPAATPGAPGTQPQQGAAAVAGTAKSRTRAPADKSHDAVAPLSLPPADATAALAILPTVPQPQSSPLPASPAGAAVPRDDLAVARPAPAVGGPAASPVPQTEPAATPATANGVSSPAAAVDIATPNKPAPTPPVETALAAVSASPAAAEASQTAAPRPSDHAVTTTAVGSASPAAQVAPALVSLARAPDGAQRMTLKLQPPELGQVEIRIDRSADAPARVEISVQRPETLTLLLRDQPQLQRALDQAGVPAEGRSLTFQVAPSPPAPQLPAHSMAAGAGGTGDGAYPGGTERQTAQSRQDQASSDEAQLFDELPPLPHWTRVGLDITA